MYVFGPPVVSEWSYEIGSLCLPSRLCIFPSFGPSVLSSVFSIFWHGCRNPYEVVCDRTRYFGEKSLPPELGKWAKNGPKTKFFWFIEKFGHYLLNLFSIDNLCYFLCSCTNSIFGKIFVPKIWAKIVSANQIAGFSVNNISRRNQWISLIFCVVIQIHIN